MRQRNEEADAVVEWSGVPAYQQVANELRRRIAAGEFGQAGRLPSYSALESEYSATTTVVRDAIRALKTEGLVVTHQGKGAFLTADSVAAASNADPAQKLTELSAAVDDLRLEVAELRARVAELSEAG